MSEAPPRKQLSGPAAIEAALDSGVPVRVVLIPAEAASARALAVAERAAAAGAAVWRGGPGDIRRMARSAAAREAMAMIGGDPQAELEHVLTGGGAVWLLHRAAYPSNVGFAVRTAEVSGATAVIVDARFNHAQRSRVSHVSMGADRLLPVLWWRSEQVLPRAKKAGFRVIALEDVGELAPWQVDLRGPVLLIAGNERSGLGPELLQQCDAVISIPMAGFVPSYNLQAAISAIAIERLRQTSTLPDTKE